MLKHTSVLALLIFVQCGPREQPKDRGTTTMRAVALESSGSIPARICKNDGDGPPLDMGPLRVTGGHSYVAGKTSPGATVYVNAVRIEVRPDGTFGALVGTFAWKTIVVAAFGEKGCREWRYTRDDSNVNTVPAGTATVSETVAPGRSP